MRDGGWHGGGKEDLCQGVTRAKLGRERKETSGQASSLGRDVEDADTTWALFQDGSVLSSQRLMRFLVAGC